MVGRTAACVTASQGDFASEATVDCDAKLFRFRGERPSARRGSDGKTIVWLLRKAHGAHLEKTTSNIKYSGFQVQNNT